MNRELPYSGELLEEDIRRLFFENTGKELSKNENPYVEKFAYGGMSSGHLSGEFWIDEALPLLEKRLKRVNVTCNNE